MAKEAWSNPDQMRVLADYLIDNDYVQVDDCKDFHKDDRRASSLSNLEDDVRRWILRRLKIKGRMGQYPISLPNARHTKLLFGPGSEKRRTPYWTKKIKQLFDIENRTHIFIVKSYNNETIINPFGIITVPTCLEYIAPHPQTFSIFDPIFAGIKAGKTKYGDVIQWIHNKKILGMIKDNRGYTYNDDGKLTGFYEK